MVFEHFEVSVSCSNNPLRPQLVHKYFRWGIKRIFLCVIGTRQKLDHQNMKKLVFWVWKKSTWWWNFIWKFLDSDARDSSAIRFHRVIVFIEEIPILSLSIVLIERSIVSTLSIHNENSPQLNKKLYCRAEESVKISALNIDQLWITIVTKLFDKTVFFLNHV